MTLLTLPDMSLSFPPPSQQARGQPISLPNAAGSAFLALASFALPGFLIRFARLHPISALMAPSLSTPHYRFQRLPGGRPFLYPQSRRSAVLALAPTALH
jgi:hypothetical protein